MSPSSQFCSCKASPEQLSTNLNNPTNEILGCGNHLRPPIPTPRQDYLVCCSTELSILGRPTATISNCLSKHVDLARSDCCQDRPWHTSNNRARAICWWILLKSDRRVHWLGDHRRYRLSDNRLDRSKAYLRVSAGRFDLAVVDRGIRSFVRSIYRGADLGED